jgi:sulfatase modifying factor 1
MTRTFRAAIASAVLFACGKELEVVAKEGGVKQTVSLRAQETTKVAAKLSGGGSAPGGMAVIPGGGAVATFSIDVTEVTVDAYAACVRAGNCSKPNDDGRCNWGESDRGNHPVNCVDWNQAKAFCGWAQKRLPTEQEWQRAAESAQGRTYPWGEAAPSNQLCWDGEGNSLGKGNRQSTCAVGSFSSGDSAQGVKDLSGNVWEWTYSCNVSACSVRGGCWGVGNPSYVRAKYRYAHDPSDRGVFLGFRCARSN